MSLLRNSLLVHACHWYSTTLPPQPPKSSALIHRGRDPLPLRWRLVVAHEIVDVMQQRLCLGEVGVAQQIDIEVRHGHCVDAWSHGVGYEVSGAGAVVW